LPFYEMKLSAIKPGKYVNPNDTKTFGGQIRKRRLALGLRQKDLASQMGVTKETVRAWEKNRAEPCFDHLPKVAEFINQPPELLSQSWGEKLIAIRRRHGLSIVLMARYLKVDPTSLVAWEHGKRVLRKHLKQRIESFVADYQKDTRQAKILENLKSCQTTETIFYCPNSGPRRGA
jgi:transcriptional regulator with XRE-family HTH domain